MSAPLLPIGHSARKVVLDLLRSGNADEALLKKAWRATQRGEREVPEAVLSEFRRIANAMKTANAVERIRIARQYRNLPVANRPNPRDERTSVLAFTGRGTREELQDVVDDISYQVRDRGNWSPGTARGDILSNWSLAARENPANRPRYLASGGGGDLAEAHYAKRMQADRAVASLDKADLERLQALLDLFGDLS